MTAKDLKVLYHAREWKLKIEAQQNAFEIGRDSGVNLEFHHSNGPEVFDRFHDPTEYDVIIMHLECNDVDGHVFRMADEVRRRYAGPVVAESFRYPLGKEEVLKHFHNYFGPIIVKENFISLLKTVGYLSADFRLPGNI